MLSKTIRTIACSALLISSVNFQSFATEPTATAEPSATMQTEAVQTLQINQASAEEIADALDGVGMTKAQAIVDYRTMHGPFTSLSMLESVKGIGAKTIAANSEKIAFDVPQQK